MGDKSRGIVPYAGAGASPASWHACREAEKAERERVRGKGQGAAQSLASQGKDGLQGAGDRG
ncbi:MULTISPECIES: hypothetical protein [Paenibacillus]|uniref:hypothetical protein n=1 Tax=Paenibacillus TaxID=44249 RepID=UPI0022B8D158|nr:hypothetical protein [Paenibacillus caseinilyticus]MCZ8519066.1 hypothetical protein [Paenibacillus caseinilyticus]